MIIAFLLPRLLLTCCYWIVCRCLFVRSSEGIKQLQTFKLPSSQKILELLLAAPCHRDPVTISVPFDRNQMAIPGKITLEMEFVASCFEHNKCKLVARQSHENLRVSPF